MPACDHLRHRPVPPRPLRRFVAVLTAGAMLAACSTREGRIGADDGTDACRPQLVALDSTGDFFAEDILKGAAIGAAGGAVLGAAIGGNVQSALIGAAAGAAAGAAGGYLSALQSRNRDQAALNASLAGDLERENGELNRTQLAFDQLMDCRFNRAAAVRDAYRRGQIPREVALAQLADQRARTQRDIALARAIDQRIGTRGAEFETAFEAVSPGVKGRYADAKTRAPVISASARVPVALRLRPDAGSPKIADLGARERVQLRPARAGYALVRTESGQTGYAETAAFATAGARGTGAPVRLAAAFDPGVGGQPGDVRSLAASNLARRDAYSESVATAERAAAGSGFELAS